MKVEIEEIIKNCNYREKHILINYYKFYQDVLIFNDKLDITWINKLYNYIYNIKGINCEYCKKPLKFSGKFKIGYGKFCSRTCTSRGTRNQVKKTNLEKYGVEYPLQNVKILKKVSETNLERYGVKSTLSDNNIKNKIKKTNLKRYGVENPSQNSIIQNKIKKINLLIF